METVLESLSEPQLPPFQNILDEVINTLVRLKEPVILVLDDHHTITNALIHEMVEYFLDHQPRQVHLVIITREDPPLPLARLRARRQMVEIRASDLRFTEEEAGCFFNQSMQLVLEDDEVQSLEMRTEGWAVGLKLAGLALKNLHDPKKFVETFSGSHRYVLDYLAEEIIRQQRDDLRKFLVQTSILEASIQMPAKRLLDIPTARDSVAPQKGTAWAVSDTKTNSSSGSQRPDIGRDSSGGISSNSDM